MKPKQWLFDNGHIADPKQRGRLSLDKVALIQQAVRDGVVIDGYSVSAVKPTADSGKAEPKVERKAEGGIADIGPELRPEAQWEAHTNVNGEIRPVGMRTVDNQCGNSLTYCGCKSPSVNIDHQHTGLVVFSLRKTPLSNKRW